ncbi:MAG: fumarylacetoacetate hydrolase family protein [Candidatus Lustribacter sp.]|jgi:acylpyruvate hydrolase
MKIVVFGPAKHVGVWAGDLVVDLAPAFPDLASLIAGGDAALAAAAKAVEAAGTAPAPSKGVHARADVQLHAPVVPGARVACAGGNFADHTAAMASRLGHEPMDTTDMKALTERLRARGIWGFWKVGREAAEPGGEIMYPARTKRLDYEGELAIVIGKRAKDVKAADLRPYVWGVTLFGDWSIRDQNEGQATFKFAMAKNFDGSFSVGPCIVVGENIDPGNVDVETWVNGDRRQQFNTRDMIISFGEYLEYLSADLTFYPGDIISGGTAKGTAADSSPRVDGVAAPERFLKPGDEVEMRSPAIGTLAARIVAKH